MHKLYMFSPITSKEQFSAALKHIVQKAEKLSEQLLDTKLHIKTVKVFAHYPDEFQFMKDLLKEYGKPSTIGRSTSMYVKSSLIIDGNRIEHIGVRMPDA